MTDDPPAPLPATATASTRSNGDGGVLQPIVSGELRGVEVRAWLVRDDTNAFAVELNPFDDRPPDMAMPQWSLWRRCGLRLTVMPLAEFARLEQTYLVNRPTRSPTAQVPSVRLVGGGSRAWVGEGPLWVEAFRGAGSTEPRTVAMHDGRVRLEPGALRLLLRCWAVPASGDATSEGTDPASGDSGPRAALRVQVVPQLLDGRRTTSTDPLALPTATGRTALDQGLLFTRLLTEIDIAPGTALVITADDAAAEPETPTVGTAQEPPSSTKKTGSGAPGRVTRGSTEADSGGAPAEAKPLFESVVQTLGGAMLTSRTQTGGEVRLVIAVIPRGPVTFDILGR